MSAKSRRAVSSIDRIKLPQPDPKNITALTRNLPNNPILPWNHYDSPLLQAESSDAETSSETSNETSNKTGSQTRQIE